MAGRDRKTETKKGKSGGKVLSIVSQIEERQLAHARGMAERTKRRDPVALVESAEMMHQLDECDFDAMIAELEAAGDYPEAAKAATWMRCARALHACVRGDVKAGLAEWEAVMAEHPETALPYIMRGRWWLQGREDPERALADFERAVVVDPGDASAYLWRARCLEVRGDVERALANYRRAAALDAKSVDLQHACAKAFSEHGARAEALAAWRRLAALEPKYVDFWVGLAREQEAAGEHEAALAAYDRALEMDPDDDSLALERMNLMTHVPREQLAGRLLTEIERLAGRMPEAVAELQPAAAQLHVDRAIAHARADRIQEAFDEASRAIELDPSLAKAWMVRGVYRTGLDHEPALAMADMDRALKLAPKDAAAHFQRGLVLRWMGDENGALAECDRAIACAPKVGKLYWERAEWRNEMSETPADWQEQNLADYDRALANGYRDVDVFVHKADTLAQMGNLKAAVAICDEALAEHPGDEWVLKWRKEWAARLRPVKKKSGGRAGRGSPRA
jgi:tetratricopeptide (TPR) repeat protein